jgi:hypothetical protein
MGEKMKNIAFLFCLTLLLAGMLTLGFEVKPARAWTGIVHIRSDGSVDPSDAPIQRDGDLYTLTSSMESGNLNGAGLVIERDNMTLDGAGYTFLLPTPGDRYVTYGIEIAGVSNTTVEDIEIDNGTVNVIYDPFSSNNSLIKTKLRPDYYGVVFESDCQGNVASENDIASRLAWTDISLSDSSNNTIVGNVIRSSGYRATIQMSNSLNNRIYQNDLYGRVDAGNLTNVWDDGYPSGGNYWSGYAGVDVERGPNQNQPGSDGINDTPYTIDANNRDHYPLISLYGSTPQPTYALTISATVNGTSDPAPGTYLYSQGQRVPVQTTPDSGYGLDHWELDESNVGSANPYSVLMDNNHTLHAEFVPAYTLTITTTANGTTSPSPGSHIYNTGTSICVTAIPDAYCIFDHWELDEVNVGSVNPYCALMDDNHTLHALFIQLNYTLTITATDGGTTDPSPGAYTYVGGSTIQITAIPSINHKLDHWELDGVNTSADNSITVTMDTNHTLHGVFIEHHDVAITNVSLYKTVVGQGYSTSINATVQNQGEYTETFNVTIYAIHQTPGFIVPIQTQTVTNIPPANETTLIFTWNTTGVTLGNYTLVAVADTVPNETDTTDNTLVDGWVIVTIPGDVDGNFRVDMGDISSICNGFGSTIGPDGNYWHHPPGILDPLSPNLDTDGNGKIDMGDITTALDNFAKHYP